MYPFVINWTSNNKPTNQPPIKKLTKGGVLRKRKPSFLIFKYSNWGYAYANGVVFLAEDIDIFRLGVQQDPSGNVFYEKNVGWINVWDLNPEGWDSFG
jgi:hypothetical protein